MSESNLEDRAAIHDLFTRYCCALDNGEIEAVVDCFTVDAILNQRPARRRGANSIRLYSPILTQGFVANAQKFLSFATTRGLTKPAALSFSVRPSFRCPE